VRSAPAFQFEISPARDWLKMASSDDSTMAGGW
jgi:hypothetical protein